MYLLVNQQGLYIFHWTIVFIFKPMECSQCQQKCVILIFLYTLFKLQRASTVLYLAGMWINKSVHKRRYQITNSKTHKTCNYISNEFYKTRNFTSCLDDTIIKYIFKVNEVAFYVERKITAYNVKNVSGSCILYIWFNKVMHLNL